MSTTVTDATKVTGMKTLEQQKNSILTDGKVTKEEFELFTQNAKAMKNGGEITEENFNEAIGWFKTQSDSLAYVQVQKNMAEVDTKAKIKQEKIQQLEQDIERMRNELYKGEYAHFKKGAFTQKQREAGDIGEFAGVMTGFATGIVPAFVYGEFALALFAVPAGMLGGCIGLVAVAGACALKNKVKSNEIKEEATQCEQQNPELYQALQYAEQQLAELKAQK